MWSHWVRLDYRDHLLILGSIAFITSAKSLFLCKVTCLQVLGIRAWATLGFWPKGILLTAGPLYKSLRIYSTLLYMTSVLKKIWNDAKYMGTMWCVLYKTSGESSLSVPVDVYQERKWRDFCEILQGINVYSYFVRDLSNSYKRSWSCLKCKCASCPLCVWGSKWVFALCNSLSNWPELEVIRLLKYQSWEANPHPELLELEGPFICSSSGCLCNGMGPICCLWPHVAVTLLPSLPSSSISDSRAAEGDLESNTSSAYICRRMTLKICMNYLPVCQLENWKLGNLKLGNKKHLILPSDYIIFTSLMCRWGVLCRSQSSGLVIVQHPSQEAGT